MSLGVPPHATLVDAARVALAALASPISPDDEDGQLLRRSARNLLENALEAYK